MRYCLYGKELPAMAIKRVFQKEPVLSIAACLALVSSCFVLPDAEYLGYIDFRTLAILFSLMTVMAGLRGQGVFDWLGRALLSHTRTTLQLTAVLVGLCFFSSMVITNDVSLLTFVPFTFVVVNSLDAAVRDKLLLPIVCMQTIAANLGSMLTPLGNPQNLYLYGKSGMDMGSFVLLMLPYSILSLALLALWAVGLCRRGAKISMAHSAAAASPNKALLSLYSIFIRALSVGGTACSALWYRVCCGSGLCAFGRPEHIMPCGLFADPYLCCALYLYWQSGAFCRLFRMVAAYSYRPRGMGFCACLTGNQQCACGDPAFGIYREYPLPDHRHKSWRPWHADCLNGQPDLVSRNCKGVSVTKRPVFCVVHSFQHPVCDGSYGRVGVSWIKTSPHNSKHSRSGS